MINLILILSGVTVLAGALFYKRWQDRRDGENKQKLKNAEETINNIKKASGAITRLNDDTRSRLQDKYRPK